MTVLDVELEFLNLIVCICLFFFGATLVSAYQCLLWRKKRGESWVAGRSHCDFCKHVLDWWELIPVIGTIILRGRCSHCGGYYGYSSATAEASLGIAYVVIYRVTGFTSEGSLYLVGFTFVDACVLWLLGRK